jgi:hypothetical protein
MGLPSIATPHFSTTIPSTGQEVEYRPFLVKEEKILLMALEGKDQKEITKATENIIQSCIITDIDINKLATFDIEFLFLRLRGKSVSEVVELKIGHTNDNDCKHKMDIEVDLEDINIQGEISDGKIMLDDTIGVKMRYPGLKDIHILEEQTSKSMFEVINSCIEYVYDKDNVYNEFTKKEIKDWVETLSQKQFEKLTNFFKEIPKLAHDVEWTCPECGEKDSIKLEGLQSFFM